MSELLLTLPELHPAQQRIKDEARRFNVLACGRRFGKTILCQDLVCDVVLDEGLPVGWFAPTYKLLNEVWREMTATLQPIITRSNATERRIDLLTGGVVEFWSLEDADAGRSRKYRRVIIDEAGLVADLRARWQEAIRPTLADYEGDAYLAGTPKGRNFFWQAWLWGQDPQRPDWAAWQLPTGANPFIKAAEVEAMRAGMSQRSAAQEIDAVFVEDGGGVFRGVRAAATVAPGGAPVAGHTYVIGADWGKSNDYTVFTVVDATARAVVAMDRSNQVDYALQRGRLAALCQRWGAAVVVAETNAMGMPIVEALSRERIPVRPFVTTNASKAIIIDALALALERGEIALLDDPILIGELEAFEVDRTPSGLTRYGAPAGAHDDCCMSLALAWSAVGRTSSAKGAFGD